MLVLNAHCQFGPKFGGIVLGWSSTKIMFGIPSALPRWCNDLIWSSIKIVSGIAETPTNNGPYGSYENLLSDTTYPIVIKLWLNGPV